MSELNILLDNLTFPEGPRWHDGRLWFSDFYSHRVIAVNLEGQAETICTVENQPSGLGWLPDGRMVVTSMEDRRLLVVEDEAARTLADLSREQLCRLGREFLLIGHLQDRVGLPLAILQ